MGKRYLKLTVRRTRRSVARSLRDFIFGNSSLGRVDVDAENWANVSVIWAHPKPDGGILWLFFSKLRYRVRHV